jgi:murein DD-endopeptidase MepM/ murein hydrolase activator NlpD
VSRLVAPALCAFSLVLLGAGGVTREVRLSIVRADADAFGLLRDGRSARCERGEIEDRGGCVRMPKEDESSAPEAMLLANMHRERSGAWASYEQIPRRPERPADYDAYRYPIPPGLPAGKSVISGYDLDLPDPHQRRGRTLRAVGHGGVDLPQARGTEVKMLALEHQFGDAEVVYVGPLFGTTVVTRHTLREGGQLRDYLLLFGHLDAAAAGAVRGATLSEGALVGYVGDTGSPELVHLHLEARRVREGVDVTKLLGNRLVAGDVSVVCDPRNVLPLR